MDNKEKIHICKICNELFIKYISYEKHLWQYHPTYDFQRVWSNIDWSNYIGNNYNKK